MTKSELIHNLTAEIAASVVIRSYTEIGNSCDTRRQSTPAERSALWSVVSGALHAAGMTTNDAERRGILDTAELIADQMIPGLNGYDSVFNPLQDAFARLDALAG